MGIRSVMFAAAVLVAPAVQAVEVAGHYPTMTNASITTSDPTATAAEIATFFGAPDDAYTGIGGQWVTYDFGNWRMINGTGNDFNIYEVDGGGVEFHLIDVLVSANNVDFFNVEASSGPAIDLVGDNAHGNASFRRSFDLGAAVLALGVSEFRYLRIDGVGTSLISGANSFDLDAVGLVNFAEASVPPTGAIPEPASWAMLLAGFGLTAMVARRRQRSVAA